MTLDQWTTRCILAVDANFRARNVRVFSDQARHERSARMRRNRVRQWIIDLRLAVNPETASTVARNVVWRIN